MLNLFLRSFIVLALLFGLLFAIGMGVITYLDLPAMVAVAFALVILLLQYALGPIIIQFIYKIEWQDVKDVDPQIAQFIERVTAERNIPQPRFGVIRDGNPNAFTFGHYPGNARLVVTSGLLDLLDPDERNAVVGHELGHIAHWDFVVMTMAAAVPLILYVLYATMRRVGDDSDRVGAYAALVAMVSFVAYLVSQYIVLLLSRVREYYADRFSGEVTHKPDALSSALVKISYGLARAPKKDDRKDDARMVGARALGIFDPNMAQALALASAGTGAVSAASMESAMKWDLWNPWAGFYELASSHPLPAKRIKALEKQTESMGGIPRFSFRAEKPESYWDEFLVDLVINYLPLIGFLVGIGAYLLLNLALGLEIGIIGTALFALCAGWWLKRQFSYRHKFDEQQTVEGLIEKIKVSRIRSIPCTIKGKIIGRGVPGLFYSDDLVLQDATGFIVLDYRQPIRIFEFLFGWLKAEKLIGMQGEARGWYRRAPRPYFELRELRLENKEVVRSFSYPLTQFFVYAGLVLGVVLAIVFI